MDTPFPTQAFCVACRRAVPATVSESEGHLHLTRTCPVCGEARTLIETIMRLSVGKSGLGQISRQLLGELEEKRVVKVFVSPSCPYCPGQVSHAFHCAIERPDLGADARFATAPGRITHRLVLIPDMDAIEAILQPLVRRT